VAHSQAIALHLHACQNAVNPGGLLVCALGAIDKMPTVAILKVEKEEGVRVQQTHIDGKLSIDLAHLRDLVLTKKTRVFKVAVLAAGPVPDRVSGLAYDSQLGENANRDVAQFFLRKFLSCKFQEEPAEQTKRLNRAGQDFVNQDVTDPELQARYELQFMAALQAETSVFRPQDFARDFLKPADRKKFMDRIAANLLPATEIPKDLTLIAGTLKRMKMTMESGLAITAPPDVFDKDVKVNRQDDNVARISIEGRIRDLGTTR
jgi:hypothetical protein